MCRDATQTEKGRFDAEVIDNNALSPHHYRMVIRVSGKAAEAFADLAPGRFAQFSVAGLALPPEDKIPAELRDSAERSLLLRRPLSFAAAEPQPDGSISLHVLYCVLGPSTLRMTTLETGDHISLIGPLGTGFTVPPGKKLALLVAGGMGAPPLQHLAARLRADHPQIKVVAFAGARTLSMLPFTIDTAETTQPGPGFVLEEFARAGVPSLVATDDGTSGHKGFITELLDEYLDSPPAPAEATIIYTCGPEMMMKVVAAIAGAREIDCQVSMERMMACGIGLCQSCAVECIDPGSDDTVYKLCCKDGPVFDSRRIAWSEI